MILTADRRPQTIDRRSNNMPTSNSNLYPDPPPGYGPAITFRYPKLALQAAAIALLFAAAPVLLWITWLLQGQPAGLPLVVADIQDVVMITMALVVTVVVHELIHGVTYQLLGYRVTYGVSWQLLAAYAGAFNQWQQRNHNIVVALAPLIVLNSLLLPLLAVSNQTVILLAFTALLFNIGGAVGDIYLTWRLLRLPKQALLYDIDPSTMLIFMPAEW